MIDAFGLEPHFVTHLAPVWRALPATLRGRFFTVPELLLEAAVLGIRPEPIDADVLRRSSPPPRARPGDGPLALVASYGDQKVARRLGYRRFIRMEHGAGQSYGGETRVSVNRHGSYPGGMDHEDVGLFLVPNTHSASRWRQAYPTASVAAVGSPRLDTLPVREPGPVTVAFAMHWPLSMCAETLPAFADFRHALGPLAAEFKVIGHGHPRWAAFNDGIRRECKRHGIEYAPDFDTVLRRADVLLFDNTSAGFEFAATGRPVVVLNARQYRRNVSHGLRFWDAASVGVQVDADERADITTRRLLDSVARALADGPEQVASREAALDIVYSDRRPGAAERAAEAIAEWAAERVTVAA